MFVYQFKPEIYVFMSCLSVNLWFVSPPHPQAPTLRTSVTKQLWSRHVTSARPWPPNTSSKLWREWSEVWKRRRGFCSLLRKPPWLTMRLAMLSSAGFWSTPTPCWRYTLSIWRAGLVTCLLRTKAFETMGSCGDV